MCVVAKPVVKNSRYTVTRHLLYESILIHCIKTVFYQKLFSPFFQNTKRSIFEDKWFFFFGFSLWLYHDCFFPLPLPPPPLSLSTPKHNRFSITLIQPFCKVAMVTCPLCFLHSNYLPIRQLLESQWVTDDMAKLSRVPWICFLQVFLISDEKIKYMKSNILRY